MKFRTKVFEKVEEKILNDLELTNLINQIKNSYDILKNLKFKGKEKLSFNESRVIGISSSEETQSLPSENEEANENEIDVDLPDET